MAFAESAFMLSKTDSKGVSVEATLRQVEKSTGRQHPRLSLPDFPDAAENAWNSFHEINQGRTGNGFGSNPITWPDLQSWSELTGNIIRPWEVRLIRALDRTWLKTFSTSQNDTPENETNE